MSPRSPVAAVRTAAQARAAAIASSAAVLAAVALALVVAEARPPAGPAVARAQLAYRLDLNTASRDELLLLPSVGPGLADALIAHRAQAASAPAFRTLADLERVRGFGPARSARIAPLLRWPAGLDFDARPPAADAPADDPPPLADDAP